MSIDLAFLPDWINVACKVTGFILLCGSLAGGITTLHAEHGGRS